MKERTSRRRSILEREGAITDEKVQTGKGKSESERGRASLREIERPQKR
jgi:hypothetical protein